MIDVQSVDTFLHEHTAYCFPFSPSHSAPTLFSTPPQATKAASILQITYLLVYFLCGKRKKKIVEMLF